MSLEVVAAGPLATVQDLGRHGYQRHGVPVGGAMDTDALRIANLLAGNPQGAAGVELTLPGATLGFRNAALFALSGADFQARLDGVPVPPGRAAWAPAGATLSLPGPGSGCRAYLALAGGVDVPPVLGSRSTFVRAGLGGLHGRALRRGDVLGWGEWSEVAERIAGSLRSDGGGAVVAGWGAGPSLLPPHNAQPRVRILPDVHWDALEPASRHALVAEALRISPRSDRTGYRLEGELRLGRRLEPLSEGVAFGTVQLPPDGAPIILMADRQTTGGYPRIAQVAAVDLPLVAQLRPGDRIRFRIVTLDEAHDLLLARERAIGQAEAAVRLRHT